MGESSAKDRTLDEFIEHELSAGDDVKLAARRALTFLSACVEGEVADASVGDRIAAARALLEHAARQPDVLGELADAAGLASGDDVAVVLSVLD